MTSTRCACRHDQAAIRRARESGNGRSISAGVAHADRDQIHAERRCHGLDCAELPNAAGPGGIPQHRHTCHDRRDLLEQLQPFRTDAVFEVSKSGSVATRPCQALDQASANRIVGVARIRSARSGLPPATRARLVLAGLAKITSGASATNSAAYLRMRSASPAPQRMIDPHVAPDRSNPACFRLLQERRDAGLPFRIVPRDTHQHADAPHPLGCCARAASGQPPPHRRAA